MLKGLVLALGGFLFFLVAHVALFQVRVPRLRFKTMVRIATAIGVGLLLLYPLTPPDLGFLPARYTGAGWAVDLLNGLLVFAFLFVGYCMFYFLVDRGFSGRMMIEIEAAPERRLRAEDIAARYSLEMVLLRRLGEMLEIGRVVERDGRYVNTPKGRAAAEMFAFVKRFLQLGEGG
jgi:hypothetical protein